jgi:hypothetical protein
MVAASGCAWTVSLRANISRQRSRMMTQGYCYSRFVTWRRRNILFFVGLGMAQVAEAAGIPRESLYRALGPRGNPRFSTLTAIMKAIGMRLTVTAA